MLSAHVRPEPALSRALSLTAAALAALAATALLDCSSPTDDGQPQAPATHYSVYLWGRVLDKDGRPVPNAIAELKGKGLRAVTNTDGVYLIVDSISPAAILKAGERAALDTVAILRDGQLISTMEVQQYIDTLPDLFVVQRDIYGAIDSTVTSFTRIEAVITGGTIPAGAPKVVELWHNTATNGYSGFVYFVYTPEVATYRVYVNVYGADSTLIGRSRTVQFSSLAGNVQIPMIDPTNAMPRVHAGADTLVSVRDTVRLHATASDSFGGAIVSYEWKVGDGPWTVCAGGDTFLVAPDAPQALVCSLRVTDNDGNWAADAMQVTVGRLGPTAVAGPDTIVALGHQINLHGSAADSMGTIVEYAWKLGAGPWLTTSSPDTTVIAPLSVQEYVCSLQVTDDDGFQGWARTVVRVVVGRPTANAGEDVVALAGDTVYLRGKGSDSCGQIVAWEWDIGGSGAFTRTSTPDTFVVASRSPDAQVLCVLRVSDDDGNQDADTVIVATRASPRLAFFAGYNDNDTCGGQPPVESWLRWRRRNPFDTWIFPEGPSYWGDIELVTRGETPPVEPLDSVLMAYPLSLDEEQQFSRTDSALSAFWRPWSGRDSIVMTPPASCHDSACYFSGPEDATVTVKAARGRQGVYLCLVIRDDCWYAQGDFWDFPLIWFDALPSDTIDQRPDMYLGGYAPWCTHTTCALYVSMGGPDGGGPGPVRFGYYEEDVWGWVQGQYELAEFASLPRHGMSVERVVLGPELRAVEILVPWKVFER